MNYTFYIIVILSIIAIVVLPFAIKRKLQKSFFAQIAIRNILKTQPLFFCSYTVWKTVNILIKNRQNSILDLFLKGNITKTYLAIRPYDELTYIALKAFDNPTKACKNLEKFIKNNPTNYIACSYLAMMYRVMQNKKQQAVWDNIDEKKLPLYFRAQYKINIAEIALKNGDLEFASQNFNNAIKLFNRCRAYYEMANVSLLLGTTYRVCFIFDVAEMLFRSALKIFLTLKEDNSCAKTYANLGMLMVGQERFDEADVFFNKSISFINAKKYPEKIAEVQNQQALMLIVQKKYKEAEKLIQKNYELHTKAQNIDGMALSLELYANSLWKRNKYYSTTKKAKKASELYKKTNNISGLLESMFLGAQALLRSKKEDDAEIILREIIDIGKKDAGCFYLANAYNLLGIIYVQKKDLRRAKGLFQQSLNLEQRTVRNQAIATDYANIGFIEMRCGNIDEACKNLNTALNFALDTGDDDLIKLLEEQIKKLNN